jgi:hypothetical protein
MAPESESHGVSAERSYCLEVSQNAGDGNGDGAHDCSGAGDGGGTA